MPPKATTRVQRAKSEEPSSVLDVLKSATNRYRDLQKSRENVQKQIRQARSTGIKTIAPRGDLAGLRLSSMYSRKGVLLTNETRRHLATLSGGLSPLEFAASVLQDTGADMGDRKWAAEMLAPYMHSKMPTRVETKNTNVNVELATTKLKALSGDDLARLTKMFGDIQDVEFSETIRPPAGKPPGTWEGTDEVATPQALSTEVLATQWPDDPDQYE